jgi:mevalonate kinase
MGANLEKKIDGLVKKGYLASEQADFLHLQRFMGNAAAHEIQAPDESELRAALDIAESLLKTLYVLPELAKDMKKSQAKLKARKTKLSKP